MESKSRLRENMLSASADVASSDMPAWKKELILRRRGKCGNQLVTGSTTVQSPPVELTAQQPNTTICISSAADGHANEPRRITERCKEKLSLPVKINMVQERPWIDHGKIIEKNDDSDSSEELRYGPGIVSKLKNRYLSLTLREATTRSRPTILNLRKATSLEHILDEDEEFVELEDTNQECNRFSENIYQKVNGNWKDSTKHVPNRYRHPTRKTDMKRARSVEVISSTETMVANDTKQKRESLHEDVLNRKEIDKKTFEINDNKTFSNNIGIRMNRPKRIAPVMNEREKPPADVVKHTMMLFEKPVLRTKAPQCTGDVAAKVATFKEIIDTKKPPLKQKPTVTPSITTKTKPKLKQPLRRSYDEKNTTNKTTSPLQSPNIPTLRSPVKNNPLIFTTPLPQSPIPDVSQVEFEKPENDVNGFCTSSLTETPDLIVHSSLKSTTPEEIISKEIKHTISDTPKETLTNGCKKDEHEISDDEELDGPPPHITKQVPKNQHLGNSIVFNFSDKPKTPNYLPLAQTQTPKVNLKRNSPLTSPKSPPRLKQKSFKVPITEPLKVEIIAAERKPKVISSTPVLKAIPTPEPSKKPPTPTIDKPPKQEVLPVMNGQNVLKPPKQEVLPVTNGQKVLKPPKQEVLPVTNVPKVLKPPKQEVLPVTNGQKISDMVKEKNLKNVSKSVKTVSEPVKSEVVHITVPKVKKANHRKQDQNCLVFDFTARKDVPDYVGNDGRIKTGKIEKPKPGEGGITLLPGATLDESLVDDDDDWQKLLEGPPSPLCVTFVNDNILIDGRSSINQKLRKPKMSIQFVKGDPDIFMYPSESSMLFEESHTIPMSTNASSVGHSVPNLSGSTLANYTPKSSVQLEEFQLGMKPTLPSKSTETKMKDNGVDESENMEDVHQPVLFSSGTNSDILF